jgi:hypothetical protein
MPVIHMSAFHRWQSGLSTIHSASLQVASSLSTTIALYTPRAGHFITEQSTGRLAYSKPRPIAIVHMWLMPQRG